MRTPGDLGRRLDQAVEELKRDGAEKIILFGSLARGEADEYSDIDLVVVKPTAMQFVERLAEWSGGAQACHAPTSSSIPLRN